MMLQKPIGLTSFEELFLLNDLPQSPSTFLVRVELSSALDRPAAERAVHSANQKNPLSTSKVSTRRRKHYWVKGEKAPQIEWKEFSFEPEIRLDNLLDIKTGPPLRIWVSDGQDNSPPTMLFLIHHVAFDGLGFFQWFRDFSESYRMNSADEQTESHRPSKHELHRRCKPGLGFWESLRMLPGQRKSVQATIQIMKRDPIPLLPLADDQDQPTTNHQTFFRIKFDRQETAAISATAAKLETSVNRLLVRDLFVAINDWQQANDIAQHGTHFRLMIPFNERNQKHREMTACNHCTIMGFDRTPDEIQDQSKLLKSIDREMWIIKKWKLSLNFWRVLSILRHLPGGMPRHACNPEQVPTALITNMGQAMRGISGTEPIDSNKTSKQQREWNVTGFDLLATLNCGVMASFSIYFFEGQLTIAMVYDTQQLTTEHASQLRDQFRSQIEFTILQATTEHQNAAV